MSVKYLLVFLLTDNLNSVSVITAIPTTTRIYDLDILGANPIRIVEGENLWKDNEESTLRPTSKLQRRSFTTATSTTNLNNPLGDEQESNSAEFSHSALRDFLNRYAEKVVKNKHQDHKEIDEDKELDEDKEGKKSWSLLNVQEHNHPYEDKRGWVTLEPIPWSLSKISKWQSKSTTTERPWDSFSISENKPSYDIDYVPDRVPPSRRPISDNSYHYDTYPDPSKNKYQMHYADEEKPSYSKPSALYAQTVHMHPYPGFQKYPANPDNTHRHDNNCNHDGNVAIITDGRPANFPSSYHENRRAGTELHDERHPYMHEGEWILLSTTKGYKHPKNKQRSLDINPQSIGTRQSVSLTVLPPLKGSKINMTTSHGGLLQVDSAFETVEQAQKRFIRMQKLKDKPKRPGKLIKKKRPTRRLTSSTIATIPRSTPPDSSAVLAAVGAGMIPATMAMLVPIAMNGKKRKKRSVLFATSNPSTIQITLPRYL